MKLRKMTSLTALLSFAVMLVTSIILYLVPQGRIVYWSDRRLLGLTKTDWGNIHINMGFLFLIAIALHIYYNWKPLLAYLRNKARKRRWRRLRNNTRSRHRAFTGPSSRHRVPPGRPVNPEPGCLRIRRRGPAT